MLYDFQWLYKIFDGTQWWVSMVSMLPYNFILFFHDRMDSMRRSMTLYDTECFPMFLLIVYDMLALFNDFSTSCRTNPKLKWKSTCFVSISSLMLKTKLETKGLVDGWWMGRCYGWFRKGGSLRTTLNICEKEVRPGRRFGSKHLTYINNNSWNMSNKLPFFIVLECRKCLYMRFQFPWHGQYSRFLVYSKRSMSALEFNKK